MELVAGECATSPATPGRSPVPPSGTITFFFSDIVGSTERWERDRSAMSGALARHDALVRAAIVDHAGFVFKTIGGAFCATFQRSEDAILAALAAGRALRAQDFTAVGGLPIRVAIHAGTADERDGDYFGPAVIRTARLLSIGHAGQILVSSTARQLADAALPPGVRLDVLGEHRLKDLSEPETVAQVVVDDVPADFPPLDSLDAVRNNLPLQLTSLIGRDADVAAIGALLTGARLVTLAGTGGVGKTRAALQVAAEAAADFPDGVWFVDFAVIRDPALVPSVVAAAAGVREISDRPLIGLVLHALRSKRTLLVFDNCEHLIDAVARFAAAILAACASVKIVATSQTPLAVGGEVVHRLSSLAVPPAQAVVSAGFAREYGAVALFEERARAADSRFALSDANVASVIEICRALDGIPLAIELAAARTKILAPRQLAPKLKERFAILAGGSRTAVPRHQTMRSLIDWSYNLLDADEQRLFRRLAIFADTFALELATQICVDSAGDEFDVIDALTSLVDKSLLVADALGNDMRYRLLETTRAYAREKLIESAEFDRIAAAHARLIRELADRPDRAYGTIPDDVWRAQAARELGDVRAALTWSLGDAHDVALGQLLAATAAGLGVSENRRWLEVAFAAVDATTPTHIRARLALTSARVNALLQRNEAALDAARTALDLLAPDADARRAWAQRYAAQALTNLGRGAEAEPLANAALVTARRLDIPILAGWLLHDLGIDAWKRGALDAARAHFGQALAEFGRCGSHEGSASVANLLAEVEFQSGRPDAAYAMAQQLLAGVERAPNNEFFLAVVLGNLAAYAIALDRFEEAQAHASRALTCARTTENTMFIANALAHLAAVGALAHPAAAAGAARILGFVDAALAANGATRDFTERLEYDRALAALDAVLGEGACRHQLSRGGELSLDAAIAQGQALTSSV